MPSKTLKVSLRKSIIGLSPKQEATVKALGLRRMHQTVMHEDTPQVPHSDEPIRFMPMRPGTRKSM